MRDPPFLQHRFRFIPFPVRDALSNFHPPAFSARFHSRAFPPVIVESGAARKALMGRASETKEDDMSRITSRADLYGLTLADLQGLYHATEQELLRAEPGSAAWRDALASLEVIARAIAQRLMRGPGY